MFFGTLKLVAKSLMKTFPAYPDAEDLANWEIFRHESYVNGSLEEQDTIKLRSSQYTYDYEDEICFFRKYFPHASPEEFKKKRILDLGSFTGGRLVHQVEKFGFAEGHGIDINPLFADAGNKFALKKDVNATFCTGFGEDLPYDSNFFDFIVSYDVIEHVQSVEKVMEECMRVLKPGGKLMAVFPQYLQPLEGHLGLVTKMHGLHWFFSGKVISAAYFEILEERGERAYWYNREPPVLKSWEKLPSLNGTSISRFREIVRRNEDWNELSWAKVPILSDGKRSRKFIFRFLRLFFVLPARVPILEELFLGRVCCVLQKKAD